MSIPNRQTAIRDGAIKYCGKSCKSGHDGTRYTKTGQCVDCVKLSTKRQGEAGFWRTLYLEKRAAIIAKSKTYYEQNRAERISYVAAWAARNPEKRRATSKSYKHRRRAAEGPGISTSDLARWTDDQRKICYWCGEKCADSFHVDHYYPLSRGGEHAERNLVISCATCNLRKGASDPYQFATRVGRLF